MHTDQQQVVRLQNILPSAVGGLLAFVVYLCTLAPGITWANNGSDGGELIAAAMSWGIPHPPGYPTYTVLGRLFSLLPVGAVSWRFNLFSAVAAATSVIFLTATARTLLAESKYRDVAAVAAGLSVAFVPLVWGQSIITEVYALNLAALSIFMWALLVLRSPVVSGFFLGMGLTTHLSSLLLLPAAVALTQRSQWKRLFISMVIGLTPLLILPILGQSDSPIVWGNPSTLSGWWWLVSGRIYQPNIGLPETGTLPSYLAQLGHTLLSQFAWIGWLLVVLGIVSRLIERRVTIWLLVTCFFYLGYTFLYQTNDAVVNLLPVFALVSPLLAAGLSRLSYFSLLFPLLMFGLNLQTVNLSSDQLVPPLANQIFEEAPPNAILLTLGDQSIFSLWYYHHVEGTRPDLILVDANLFAFDWYRQRLSQQHDDLLSLEEDNIPEFTRNNGRLRPVCYVELELGGIDSCEGDG